MQFELLSLLYKQENTMNKFPNDMSHRRALYFKYVKAIQIFKKITDSK